MHKPQRLGAQMLLAAIGGLAAMVAGAGGHYCADYQTTKKKSTRTRLGHGNYGRNLMAHFDSVGINWSAKKNRISNRSKPVALRRAA